MFDVMPDGDWGGAAWRLLDPRPLKAEAPYTYFIPSTAELARLEPGDVVMLEFVAPNPDDYAGQRLPVQVDTQTDDHWFGILMSAPHNLAGLEAGSLVEFRPWHIVAVPETRADANAHEEEARFLACALVDGRILSGAASVGALERRQPSPETGQTSPYARIYGETGWVFYPAGLPRMADQAMDYVPIGLVLNIDDTMLPLLRKPTGTRIIRWREGWRTLPS
ncbi:hypothetical protein [Sagittula stellata]|uniref:Uncharacterized protein n=1 Tax=Sagittula stellata (strain ATCC 700073 / DSM 11524 / E-37) TaxID=388399 RepID=A3JZ85_SAGS3|nr:hypothetical protein [Sagittula stellata]EBA09788.1 hypothetical protein SSE37_08268 [Sagittula stellata E-37]